MCGIVGYVGNKKCIPILINGLLKLEYRGYDSAGIATISNNYINIIKCKGRVCNLQNQAEINNLTSTTGIAHTRWATHGIPSKENAHPHMDNLGNFAVVHNGIIENYLELKNFLIDNGYFFYSETDTEVIPNLIHYFYTNDLIDDKMKLLRAVKNTCAKLKGSYALEIISKFNPNTVIAIRKSSPLIIGTNKSEKFIASDIPAILQYTNDFYFLADNEFAVITKNKLDFYDKNLVKQHKNTEKVDINCCSINKSGYKDYMLKEVYEQSTSIQNTFYKFMVDNNISFPYINIDIGSINMIYIVACGTAMHAGLCGKFALESLCNIPTIVDISSEFRYRNPLLNKNSLCIFISQSGETADTIAALELAKSKGATTLAITNVFNSSITRKADYSLYTYSGPEIAVASTKAYTSQITLLVGISIYFSELLANTNTHFLKDEILTLPNKIKQTLQTSSKIKKLAKKLYNKDNIFFLGRGIDYITSMEASLKLKEISYIHSEAFAAGELKHGPIALIDNESYIICTITDSTLIYKVISNIEEVTARGAKTIIITSEELQTSDSEFIIKVPKTNKLLSPILSIIPHQLLAYYIAKEKGLDVDKPRNLAKSVTVE